MVWCSIKHIKHLHGITCLSRGTILPLPLHYFVTRETG